MRAWVGFLHWNKRKNKIKIKIPTPTLGESSSVLEGVEGTSPILGNQASEAYLTTEYKVTAHFNYFTYNHYYHEIKCKSIEPTVQRLHICFA